MTPPPARARAAMGCAAYIKKVSLRTITGNPLTKKKSLKIFNFLGCPNAFCEGSLHEPHDVSCTAEGRLILLQQAEGTLCGGLTVVAGCRWSTV